ncbi:MAG: DUF3048 domain-containing protein [Lachnospiraceae bacterium]|nr:DUF3048 domain-containing protein [Lachnospiraceae bacterium]
MRKVTYGILLASALLLFTGCSALTDDASGPILPETDSVADNNISTGKDTPGNTVAIVTEDDSLPPEEGMVRSRLTNEWVSPDVAGTRPIAVIIPNEKAALPHYGLSQASILYEANVEGRMTRMMAIYEDWQDLEKIGNVRSLRSYFAYWSFEWDAFLVHMGGPFFINDLIAQPDTENINGLDSADQTAFFRTTDKSKPHNAYTSGPRLANRIQQKGYSLEYRGLTEEAHYKFASKADPNTLEQYGDAARNATYIDTSGCYPLTRCYFEFNESDGLYYRFQHLSGDTDGPHTDAATGEQLAFKNILVQNTFYEELGLEEDYIAFRCHDNTMDGWYFTNGKGIHVTWEKSSDYGATRYYDDNGDEISLNTGKTMICIVEDGDTFSFH